MPEPEINPQIRKLAERHVDHLLTEKLNVDQIDVVHGSTDEKAALTDSITNFAHQVGLARVIGRDLATYSERPRGERRSKDELPARITRGPQRRKMTPFDLFDPHLDYYGVVNRCVRLIRERHVEAEKASGGESMPEERVDRLANDAMRHTWGISQTVASSVLGDARSSPRPLNRESLVRLFVQAKRETDINCMEWEQKENTPFKHALTLLKGMRS